jgi:glutamate racemase
VVDTASRKAIGVFDSGVGGLTVVKEICKKLPHEQIIDLGDTARVPYGTRSAHTVQRYAISNTDFLLKQDIKLLVIACNTASAVATGTLQDKYDIPIIDVIRPGARAAAAASRTKRIGIIGTEGTIASGAYQKEIGLLDPSCRIFAQPCPMFVPLAENGWCSRDDEVVTLTARRYLAGLIASRIDTLVLGCTHYPLLRDAIQSVMGPEVTIIDSAEETARDVFDLLAGGNILNRGKGAAGCSFFVTDIPHRFSETGSRFFGRELENVSVVDIIEL